ncbi:cytoskeletal protein binding protein [Rhizina undulata]
MPSLFLGIYTAVYAYAPQSDQELSLNVGDLLYILEKSTDDDWWKAKKRSNSDDEEPIGLVPSNYIEEAVVVDKYKALYDYARQTEEEVSFSADDILDIYDATDPDWALVGIHGEYGFAPANYIEKVEGGDAHDYSPAPTLASQPAQTQAAVAAPKHVSFSPSPIEEPALPPTPPRPQSMEASAFQQRGFQASFPSPRPVSPPMPSPSLAPPRPTSHHEPQYEERYDDHREDHLSDRPRDKGRDRSSDRKRDKSRDRSQEKRSEKRPSRPKSMAASSHSRHYSESDDSDGPRIPHKRPGHSRFGGNEHRSDSPPIPTGFVTYPVQEVDSKKKRSATLGLGPNKVILLPDKSTRPKEEWTVENLTGYNSEGKHVFMEFEHPSRSLDLHAGSKDVAEEIVNALADLRGAMKQAGLSEVIAAASSSAKPTNIGTVLYDFPAQGEDEVSVVVGDEVVILDDSSEEWWLVRRQVNGEKGVVPSSYIERGRKNISAGIMASPSHPKERLRAQEADRRASGIPQRTSSLAGNGQRERRKTNESGVGSDWVPATPAKPSMTQPLRSRYQRERSVGQILLTSVVTEPDNSQIRTWTDRTGSFKVEAQFLGYKDGKIHLHKTNGVKIAVPVSKMSNEDVQYVEKRAGISLEEYKPLADFIKDRQAERKKPQPPEMGITVERPANRASTASALSPALPSPITRQPGKDDYDWFEFFLNCGVDVNLCQRYALNFQKDNMDESILPDITAEVLRTLGLKEGDILRVVKKLDEKYGRAPKKGGVRFGGEEVIEEAKEGRLFSGPGGALKNNTSRSRPAPAIVTSDTIDPKAFEQNGKSPSPALNAVSKSPPPADKVAGGFEDDAWAPKPSKAQSPPPVQPPKAASPPAAAPAPTPAAPPPAPLIGALGDLSTLSLSTPPLQPTVQSQPPPQPVAQQPPMPQITGFQGTTQSGFMGSVPAISQPPPQLPLRTRPVAPMITGTIGGSLIPPPPARPVSAPQGYNMPPPPNGLNPLTSTYTGNPQMSNYGSLAPIGQPSMLEQRLSMQPTGSFQPVGTGYLSPQINGMPYMQVNGYNQVGGMQHPMPLHPPGPGFQPLIISQPTGQVQPGFGQPSLGYTPTGMGINSVLAPPLIPQSTGLGTTQQQLKPQPTGPAPPVRFGVAAKLTPQPTGRANLSKASKPVPSVADLFFKVEVADDEDIAPDNPFGF